MKKKKERDYKTVSLKDHFEIKYVDFVVQDCSKKRNETNRRTPVAKVRHLPSFVEDLLDEFHHQNLLTWQHGAIPEDELWIKIGGDHGGGSFKLCLQLVNVDHPNSKHNTFIISLFNEKDSTVNLQRVFSEVFRDDILDLQSMVWHDKRVRLFLCGDYDFLCKIYGLSGAQGVHPCLWCLTTKDKIQKPPQQCIPSDERTLNLLKADFQSFQAQGRGNKSQAKFVNNVCSEPVSEISLSHVCPPYLHILLGVTQKHHHLLEKFCHELDVSIAKDIVKNSGEVDKTSKFGFYVTQLKSLKSLYKKEQRYILQLESDTRPQAQTKKLLAVIQEMISKLKANCNLAERVGPIASSLETTLKKNNIHVEAYHGRSFVENHANKYLKEETHTDIAHRIKRVCRKHTQTKKIIDRAKEISKAFFQLNTLYSSVHSLVGHDSPVSKDDIAKAAKAVKKYMSYFRRTFPQESVTPKQHMLEQHVCKWMESWGFGMALHGEQGVEQTHAVVNALKPRVRSIMNEGTRVDSLIKEHYMVTTPSLKMKFPKQN